VRQAYTAIVDNCKYVQQNFPMVLPGQGIFAPIKQWRSMAADTTAGAFAPLRLRSKFRSVLAKGTTLRRALRHIFRNFAQ